MRELMTQPSGPLLLHPAVQALLREQHGVVSRRQLRRLGFGEDKIDGLVQRGWVQRVQRGVYRMSGAPVPCEQASLAAVLRCGDDARLTGAVVLALLGVDECRVDVTPTVIVPPSRRAIRVSFEVLRDPLPVTHRATVRGIPSTHPRRAAIDVASTMDGDAFLAIVDRMRWMGLLKPAGLLDSATELLDLDSGHVGAKRIVEMDRSGSFEQESSGERRLATLLAGIQPQPKWGVWITPHIRVDALFEDERLILEYDGRSHHTLEKDRRHDAARQQRLERMGYEVIRIRREDLDDLSALHLRILQRLIARRGHTEPMSQA